MKFLVDAQLPRRMCAWLASCGHDALHTLDLPLGNRTPDAAVMERADADGRVLVTKDNDFVQSRLLRGRPQRFLLVATGNLDNRRLESLLRAALPQVEKAFEDSQFVELGAQHLSVRD